MAKLIFVGMDKREIVGVIPKETRRKFPNVSVAIIGSIDELTSEMAYRQNNIVVFKENGEKYNKRILQILGIGTGFDNCINSSVSYNPSKRYYCATIVYSQLENSP